LASATLRHLCGEFELHGLKVSSELLLLDRSLGFSVVAGILTDQVCTPADTFWLVDVISAFVRGRFSM